jgi:hypothetical protein
MAGRPARFAALQHCERGFGGLFRLYSRFTEGNGMSTSFDFIAACRPGSAMRTRDRSEAIISRVDAAEGLIYGDVRMFGPCVWRQGGRYRDAPAGRPDRSI